MREKNGSPDLKMMPPARADLALSAALTAPVPQQAPGAVQKWLHVAATCFAGLLTDTMDVTHSRVVSTELAMQLG